MRWFYVLYIIFVLAIWKEPIAIDLALCGFIAVAVIEIARNVTIDFHVGEPNDDDEFTS